MEPDLLRHLVDHGGHDDELAARYVRDPNRSRNLAGGTNAVATIVTTWGAWNQNYTLTGSVGTTADFTVINPTWTNWLADQQQPRAQQGRPEPRNYAARPTQEQLAEALVREQQYRADAEARAKKAMEAEARAEKLLRTCLSEEQIEQLKTRNFFYVEIQNARGKKERYRIDRGSHGNVKQVDEKGSVIRSFCIQPLGVPVPDVMLHQKLWLEASDETREKFWEVANITPLMAEKNVPEHIPRPERYRYAREHGLLH